MAITADQIYQIETLLEAHPEYSNARIAKEIKPNVSGPTVQKHRARLNIASPTRQNDKGNGVRINYVLAEHAKTPKKLETYVKYLIKRNMFVRMSNGKVELHPSCDIPYMSEYFKVPQKVVRKCILRNFKALKLNKVIDNSLAQDIDDLRTNINNLTNLLESTAETFEILQLIRDIIVVSEDIEL